MTAPRGLFVDLDGTLADSLTAMRRVYRDFLNRFGKVATDAEFDRLNGPPLKQVVAMLKASHDLPGDAGRLYGDYLAMIAAAHPLMPPAEGATDVLTAARARGWVVGVVTSAAHAATESWLARNGLSALVDLVVGGDDVEVGKPDPEPYLMALRRSGCDVHASRAVEDSAQGAIAASSAGLGTWVVGATLPGPLAGRANILGVLPRFADVRRHL